MTIPLATSKEPQHKRQSRYSATWFEKHADIRTYLQVVNPTVRNALVCLTIL